ncbi:hypothetical protein [uncultured Kordia sp.]|uniref:AbiTii domain-containing protein n=1 Tax=uncultured Kordia sp. TaxID=507699 RepID=UPI0026043185|nr:hypothetical protein [uncultured Kordia sp.]
MIKELITDLAYDRITLSQALTRAKLIAAKTQNEIFANWVSKELNGYENDNLYLPSYRKLWTEITLVANYPYGREEEFPLVFSDKFDNDISDQIHYLKILQPISIVESNIQDMEEAKGYVNLPAGLVQLISKLFKDSVGKRGGVISSGNRVIGKAHLQNIIELTKQKLLDTLIELDTQFPKIDDAYAISNENNEKVNTIINNNIYGNNNPFNLALGDNTTQGDINLSIGESEKEKLKRLGLNDESIKELEVLDRENPKGSEKRKEKVMGWLSKITASLVSKGIYDSIPALTEFIGSIL